MTRLRLSDVERRVHAELVMARNLADEEVAPRLKAQRCSPNVAWQDALDFADPVGFVGLEVDDTQAARARPTENDHLVLCALSITGDEGDLPSCNVIARKRDRHLVPLASVVGGSAQDGGKTLFRPDAPQAIVSANTCKEPNGDCIQDAES
jgi:hypothetical protein